MLTRLETARIQEFGNDGKPLVGGKLYFFQLQTTTPKETYQDVFGTAFNTNPVILDSVGSAEIYLFGSYTCSAVDQYDVPVGPPVDIAGGLNDFIGGGSGDFATNVVYSVNTYADVRNLNTDYAWVFVQGRETQADGGQGLFYFSQDSSLDDDGITLSPNVPGSYVRYNIVDIDPRWFGMVYGGITTQDPYLTLVAKASERYGINIKIDGEVFINSNYTTSAYRSAWEFTDKSSLVSTLGVTFTFASGTSLVSCGRRVFKNNISVKFDAGVCSKILYSWFDADNNEGRIQKFLEASTENYVVEIDEKVVTTQNLEIPDNYTLEINSTEDYLIYFQEVNPLNFKCNNVVGSLKNVVKFSDPAAIGTITTSQFLPISFWCPVLDADNLIALTAAFRSGRVTVDNSYYTLTHFYCGNVQVKGSTSYVLNLATITCGNTRMEDLIVIFSGISSFANLEAIRCTFLGSGAQIDTEYTKISDSTSVMPFSGEIDAINTQFGTFTLYEGRFLSCINCSFTGSLVCSLEGSFYNVQSTSSTIYTYGDSRINNYTAVNANFNVTGSLVCSNLNISATDNYNMCYGPGTISFINSVFDPKITLSNTSRQVSAYGCVGQVREYNTIIDNIPQNNFYITSADITNSFWQATSAVKSPVTVTAGFLSPVAGTYTYGPGGSALIRVTSASDAAIIAFKTYGGRIRVTTTGATGSRFKVVLHRPNLRMINPTYSYDSILYNPGISTSGTYAETPYITDDSSKEYQVFCGVNNMSILNHYDGGANTTMWPTLTDYHNIRVQPLLTAVSSVNPVEGNMDVVIVGNIATGCKIKIELITEIPKTDEVFNTYYTQRKFPINTQDTILSDFYTTPFYSSGNNGVSWAWIDCPKFSYIDDKLFISGKVPGVISARGNIFQYYIRKGLPADPYGAPDQNNWIFGYYNLSATTSAVFQENVSINLDVYKTSSAKSTYEKPLNYNGWV